MDLILTICGPNLHDLELGFDFLKLFQDVLLRREDLVNFFLGHLGTDGRGGAQ